MELNEYFVEWLIRERLTEARAHAARRALLDSASPPCRPVRVAVGRALIRLGHWILRQVPEHVSEAGRLA